jgi:hypothetical protein
MSAPADSPIYDVTDEPAPTVPAPAPNPTAEDRPRDSRWGFLADGITPRRKPGRPRGKASAKATTSTTPRARTRRQGPAATSKPSAPKPPQPPKTQDFTEALSFLLGAFLVPVSMVFPLDALAVSMRGKELIGIGNQIGNDIPTVGKWLSEAQKWTPYAASLSMAVGIGAQIAHNHGWVPEKLAVQMGGVPRTQLAAMLAQQRAQAAADKAAEQAAFEAAMAEAMGTQMGQSAA